jgi:Tol biopolymer transport system component
MVVVKVRSWADVNIANVKDSAPSTSSSRLTLSRSYDTGDGWMGNNAVLFHSDRTGRYQVFRQQLGTETAEPIFQGPDDQQGAQLTPDGKWILYWSIRHGDNPPPANKLLMRLPAGGGSPEKVMETRNDDAITFACPNVPSASCVLARPENGQLSFYQLNSLSGAGKQIGGDHLLAGSSWAISPDGSNLALTSHKNLPGHIVVVNLAGSSQKLLTVSPAWDVRTVAWSADGRSLFALGVHSSDESILNVDLSGKASVVVKVGRDHIVTALHMSPDGRHLAYSLETWESNAWLLENF